MADVVGMRKVAIVSEDPAFGGLLAQNLRRRRYEVVLYPIPGVQPGHGMPWPGDVWFAILDLSWFDPARREVHDVLRRLCQTLPRRPAVLADESWSQRALDTLRPARVLRKPFAMDAFVRMVQELDHPP